jgi:hypothetical protein
VVLAPGPDRRDGDGAGALINGGRSPLSAIDVEGGRRCASYLTAQRMSVNVPTIGADLFGPSGKERTESGKAARVGSDGPSWKPSE